MRKYEAGAKTCQIWRYGARLQSEFCPGGQRTLRYLLTKCMWNGFEIASVKSMRIWSSGEYFTNRNYGTHTVEEMQVQVSNY